MSLSNEQFLRFSRHLLLDNVGIKGQQRFINVHVFIAGLGGLGSPVALYLAAAGVGKLSICDHDKVEITNLQRQILYRTSILVLELLLERFKRHGEIQRYDGLKNRWLNLAVDAKLDCVVCGTLQTKDRECV